MTKKDLKWYIIVGLCLNPVYIFHKDIYTLVII